mgnify:CR=1 FL=1
MGFSISLNKYIKYIIAYLITLAIIFAIGSLYNNYFYKKKFQSSVSYKMLAPFPGLRIEFENTLAVTAIEKGLTMNLVDVKKCDKAIRDLDFSFSDMFLTVDLFHSTKNINKDKCLKAINAIVLGESDKFLDFITNKYQSIITKYIIGAGKEKPYDSQVALMADKNTFIPTEQWMEFSTIEISNKKKLLIKTLIISIIVSFIIVVFLAEIRKKNK